MDFIETLEGFSRRIQKTMIEYELKKIKEKIENEIAGDALDEILYLLLNAMSLLFLLNREYRRNIKDFKASYVICSQDGTIDVSAIFDKSNGIFGEIDRMTVRNDMVDNPTVKITFKNGPSMIKFLLSGDPDVIAGMLDNDLSVSGNLNYLFKFVYLLWLIPELLGIHNLQNLLKKPA